MYVYTVGVAGSFDIKANNNVRKQAGLWGLDVFLVLSLREF